MSPTDEDVRFTRAKQIVNDAEEKHMSGEETFKETLQRLAFLIADLERKLGVNEYTQT